jgi:hypothetical protein
MHTALPLWVKKRHQRRADLCLLYLRKRTFADAIRMSALGQQRTFKSSALTKRKNPNWNLVDPSQLGCRQAYRLFKLTVADVARPRVSNAMSGDVLRPFRCDYLRTTLRTLPAKCSAHG